MARDIDQLIDAAGLRMLGEAPPMPAPLARAVRSRRRAIVIRHAATVAACLTVVAGAVTALMLARHTAPPHVPSAEPIAITSVGDVEAQPAPRPPTLGAFRAATRLGAEGAALATDQPLPSTPPELATPFRAHQLPDLHR